MLRYSGRTGDYSGMNDDLEWDEELIASRWEPEMELEEDIFVFFCRINPYLMEVMEQYNLEIEK